MVKTIYIDQNKSLYVIICAKCGHINKYYKIIKDELCFCKKCKTKINPLTWNETIKWDNEHPPNLDTRVCGLCAHYDGRYCMIHAEYGELVERDTCSDYVEVFK